MGNPLIKGHWRIFVTDRETFIGRAIKEGFIEYVSHHHLPWEVFTLDGARFRPSLLRQLTEEDDPTCNVLVGQRPNEDLLRSSNNRLRGHDLRRLEQLWGGEQLLIASCSQTPSPRTAVHVRIDDDAIAETAVQHFQSRNISCIGSVDNSGPVERRQLALAASCQRHGLTYVAYRPTPHPNPEQHLADWLKGHGGAIGILSHNDASANWLTDLCAAHRIPIPTGVAILGVNNDEPRCLKAHPQISSVVVPWCLVGRELAEGLHRIWRGESAPQVKVCRPMAVLARKSTAALSQTVTDKVMARAAKLLLPKKQAMLSVAEVAKRIGMSSRRLNDRFQEAHGCTPKQWQQRERIELAKVALVLSSGSVAKIAGDLHFPDYRHFSTTFRQHTGMSPSAFRDQPISHE